MYYPAPGVSDMLRRRALAVELAEARPLLVRARAGVVLSTGGFIFNREMVARHAPKYLRNFRLGTSGCDGSGIRLGQSVGGECARLERVSAWRFINPPLAWARGMIVDCKRRALLQRGSLRRKARLRNVRASRRQGVAGDRFDDPARGSQRSAVRRVVGISERARARPDVCGSEARQLDRGSRAADRQLMRRRCLQSWQSYNRAAHSGDDPLGQVARFAASARSAAVLCAGHFGRQARVSMRRADARRPARRRDRWSSENRRRRHRARPLRRGPRRRRDRIESLRERTGARGLHLVGPARRPLRGARRYEAQSAKPRESDRRREERHGTRSKEKL